MDILPVVININPEEDESLGTTALAQTKSFSDALVQSTNVDFGVKQDQVVQPMFFQVDSNYDSFYLNPDLESLLNRRGFSTQRAEILGMFNYNAPLTKGTASEDATDALGIPHLITPSGELYDYQCQLKQMRYGDALGFLEKMLGFSVVESNGSKKLSSNFRGDDPAHSLTLAQRREILNNYQDEMDTASAVIDYLAAIYNAISAFIDAQDIGKRYLIFPTAADAWQPGGNHDMQTPNTAAIYSALCPTDLNISVISRLSSENKMTIAGFVEGIMALDDQNLSGGSGNSIENFKSNSGTASILNILNIAAAAVIGIKGNTEMQFNGADRGYYKGQLIGMSGLTITTPSILKDTFSYKLYQSDKIQIIDSSDITYTEDQIFAYTSNSDTNSLGYRSYYTYLSNISYLIGLDTIQGHQLTKNTKLGNVTTSPGMDPKSFVDRIVGRDVSYRLTSILNSLPDSNTKSMTRCILPKDNDQTQGSSRDAIETFTSTNYSLAATTASSRTGRSYYCDEIPSLEYDESIQRIEDLKKGMENLGSNLTGIAKLNSIKNVNTYLDSAYQYGYYPTGDSSDHMVPSTFFHYNIKSLKDSLDNFLERDLCGTIHEDYILSHIGAAMAAEDPDFRYMVGGYNLAYYDYQHDNITKAEWEEIANVLEFRILEKIQKDLFEAYERGEVDGDGHAVWYGDGSTPDDKIHHEEIYDNQAYRPSSMSSDYQFRPKGSEGQLIDQEGGRNGLHSVSDKDDVLSMLAVFGGKLKNWGGSSTLEPPQNVLLCPYHTWRRWTDDIGLTSENHSPPSPRGIDDKNIIMGAYAIQSTFWNKAFRASIYFQAEVNSQTYQDGKNEWTVSTTWVRALLGFNKRSLVSFVNSVDIFHKTGNIGGYTIDPETYKSQTGTSIDAIAAFGVWENWDHSSGYGYYGDIKHFISKFKAIAADSVARERIGGAALIFGARASDQLALAAGVLYDAVIQSSIEGEAYAEVLSSIKDDPEFQKASLLGITRDQLTLNRALHDSIGSPNREYPYIPATKAIMTNQSKNLSGFLKLDSMLGSASDSKRFISPIGIPAGLIESLRTRMTDATGDLSYRYSNIIEVSIWKRDLLHEGAVFKPKRYVFDISKFIIEGRQTPTAVGSSLIDAATSAIDPQDFESVMNKIVVRGYTPDGNVQTTLGKLDATTYYSTDHGVDSNDMFKNHVIDSHLKTFMQLTTGFDVHEDIFPFLEGNVFFDGVDSEQEALYNTLAEKAKYMFVDRDLESAINYSRLLGELKRSILLSPKKYRNRIVYPKIFDRVFCILVDPSSFSLGPGDLYMPVPSSVMGEFTQYYCTIALKPAILSGEYEGTSNTADLPPVAVALDSYIAANNSTVDLLNTMGSHRYSSFESE